MYTRPEDDTGPPNIASARRLTIYETREGRPRWVLHMQAVFWRVLMRLGMFFHKLALPRPPKPNFSREIPSTISGKAGKMTLYFYTPKDYSTQRLLWLGGTGSDAVQEQDEAARTGTKGDEGLDRRLSRRLSATVSNVGQTIRKASAIRQRWGGYPVVINFHGGGFTIGSADDDARWCGTVVDECHAVVVSVDYRLAPEHPFPTAVEDGVDAVLYIYEHAEELGIDREKIALSGFSSGANMCFTVPLRLYDEKHGFPRDEVPPRPPTDRQAAERAFQGAATVLNPNEGDGSPSSSSTKVATNDYVNNTTTSTTSTTNPNSDEANTNPDSNESMHRPVSNTSTSQLLTKTSTTTTTTAMPEHPMSAVKICMIIPWYPPVDYTRSREQRRATMGRPDQELPALFTNLFDDSYLHPPHTIALSSPYLSPSVAPSTLLSNALPDEIIMHTCEWDMLLDEGRAFYNRLIGPEIGKKVWYQMVEGVPHGWDKAPNPWKPTPGVREHYLRACKEMRRVFGLEKGAMRPPIERLTTKGFPTVAAKDSVQVVR